MPMKNKVIISCAVTGSVHTAVLSTALAWTPEGCRESIAAANAGAAILHLSRSGTRATVGRPVIGCSHVSCGLFMSAPMRLLTSRRRRYPYVPEERLAAALRFKPELCSLNMG